MKLAGGFEEGVASALQAVAGELLRTFDRLEEEVNPALETLGSLVGGLFGTGTVSDEQVMRDLNRRGVELRERILARPASDPPTARR